MIEREEVKRLNLYELKERYKALVDAMENCEDAEEMECIFIEMQGIDASIDAKADAYARIIRNCAAEVEGIKAEVKRLNDIKAKNEAVIEKLKENLLCAMRETGREKVETSIGKWSVRAATPHVEVTDTSKVPKEFLRFKEPDVNKGDILKLFRKTGEIVDGTDIVFTDGIMFK